METMLISLRIPFRLFPMTCLFATASQLRDGGGVGFSTSSCHLGVTSDFVMSVETSVTSGRDVSPPGGARYDVTMRNKGMENIVRVALSYHARSAAALTVLCRGERRDGERDGDSTVVDEPAAAMAFTFCSNTACAA